MIGIISAKKDYTNEETGKTTFSVLLGDSSSAMVSKEQYDNLKVGQAVFVQSQKLKTKSGAFFTLKTLVPITLGQ